MAELKLGYKASAEQFGPRLAEQAAAKAGEAAGRNITAETAVSQEVAGGGVLVKSADGPEMVDNSFATRIRRCRHDLRGKIAETVFGDGSE